MLKRFYSKKSGFTLVEIIVAFAVFAIMAAMIVQILDLSVAARRSNNIYQSELAEQERLLTVVQKTNKDYTSTKGTISFTIGSAKIDLPYDMLSAKSDAENAAAGLNYFVSPVNYQATGEVSPSDAAGGQDSGSNTGSQASRMDTRLTGTGGIGYIWVRAVVKDTFTYPKDSIYAVPEGCTRYYFRVSASSTDLSGKTTLADEDMGYSQYRMFFYDDEKLNSAASSIPYTDKNKNEYTKNVAESLTIAPKGKIASVGYVNANVADSSFKGLTSSNIGTSTNDDNKYTVQQSGTNAVRIGSPFVKPSWDKKGVEFVANSFSNFYVDFVGEDVKLSTESFGANAKKADGVNQGHTYSNCPNYREEYDENGKPLYLSSGDPHVNIYGAFLHERKYGTSDDGGDDA